ncbi:HNH endonuclease [Archangium lipolyticum]|uniref:HNH endonuclease n=1 Tax=Archangium lipolyticum TaxID=2970465 RepID=UPI00389958A5
MWNSRSVSDAGRGSLRPLLGPGQIVTPPLNETHVDHRIPSAKGGPSEVDNGQVLCRDCNLKKGDKVPPGK